MLKNVYTTVLLVTKPRRMTDEEMKKRTKREKFLNEMGRVVP
jgi:hypothetical protein